MASAPIVELSGSALPPPLLELPAPPAQVFLVGRLPPTPWAAIVGTRTPSAQAEDFTRALAKGLVEAGVVVASGGARGIDRAAHEAALDAGGATVVAAASSYDRPCPEEHRVLFERAVASGGGYLWLHGSACAATRSSFFARNQLLVALSDLVVLVETRVRGGSRNTAKHARRLGRPLYVVPAAPWSLTGAGCVIELELGARPLASVAQLVRALKGGVGVAQGQAPGQPLWPSRGQPRGQSAAGAVRRRGAPLPARERRDAASVGGLGRGPEPSSEPASTEPSAEPSAQLALPIPSAATEHPIVEAVRSGAHHPDAIADRTQLAPQRLAAQLFELLLSGALKRDAAGLYRLPRRR